jgi:hypothetical protein
MASMGLLIAALLQTVLHRSRPECYEFDHETFSHPLDAPCHLLINISEPIRGGWICAQSAAPSTISFTRSSEGLKAGCEVWHLCLTETRSSGWASRSKTSHRRHSRQRQPWLYHRKWTNEWVRLQRRLGRPSRALADYRA